MSALQNCCEHENIFITLSLQFFMSVDPTKCYCGSPKSDDQDVCRDCKEFFNSTGDLTERIEFVTQKIKNNDFRKITSDD